MDLNTKGHEISNILVATGSKDKTIAVTPLENVGLGSSCKPLYVSNYHSSKVGCVHMQGWESSLVGSASDDGSFAVHDIRSDVTSLQNDYTHLKPHSFVWHPTKHNVFMTAGYDDFIHVWDMRHPKHPTFTCKGHVPNTVKKIKRIHRPTFLQTTSVEGTHDYILTGSENSQCLSIYECNYESTPESILSVYSRGNLPNDCNGDACCITSTTDSSIYVSLSDGNILLLNPN
jgi:WD40 repeat protein